MAPLFQLQKRSPRRKEFFLTPLVSLLYERNQNNVILVMSLYMGPPLTYIFFHYVPITTELWKRKRKLSLDLFVLIINLMDPKELSFTPNCKMNMVGFRPTIGWKEQTHSYSSPYCGHNHTTLNTYNQKKLVPRGVYLTYQSNEIEPNESYPNLTYLDWVGFSFYFEPRVGFSSSW